MAGILPESDSAFVQRNQVLAVFFCCLAMMFCGKATQARELEVLQVRTHSDARHTRVVLDLNGPANYQVYRQDLSDNLIVRVSGARNVQIKGKRFGTGLLQALAYDEYDGGAEVTLELSAALRFKYFFLKANDGAPNRIVVDLFPDGNQEKVLASEEGCPGSGGMAFTVVIDAGHGGRDSGAVRASVEEKDVVLDIAKSVQNLLADQQGFNIVMTREDDSYHSLESRVAAAEAAQGAVLVSIHCNTHSSATVKGTDVFCQSLVGAEQCKQKELLAEGGPDRVLGSEASLEKDKALSAILLDIHTGQVMGRSAQLAEYLLVQVADEPGLTRRRIRQGQYKVLNLLSMPAVLVEVAFMSNPEELKMLASPAGRLKIANVVARAIVKWKKDQERYMP